MDDTQDLHHQQQLDEQEDARLQLDLVCYKAIGVALALRDTPSHHPESAIKRLIELANEYDIWRAKL